MTTNSDEMKLLPCPFCGCEEPYLKIDTIQDYGCCPHCWATGPQRNSEENWNSRVPSPDSARVAVLEAALRDIAGFAPPADPADDPNDYQRGLAIAHAAMADIAKRALQPGSGDAVMALVRAAKKGKPSGDLTSDEDATWKGLIEMSFPTYEDARDFRDALSRLDTQKEQKNDR